MINIDIHRLVEQLLAPFLRQEVRLKWLHSLFTPIKTMWDSYAVWRAEKFYKAHVTAQVISIEAYLNRLFDPEKKRIVIDRGRSKDCYLSLWSEPDGPYLNAEIGLLFYLDGEYSEEILGEFTVNIPQEVDEVRVAGVIDSIKAAGTAYIIETIIKQ